MFRNMYTPETLAFSQPAESEKNLQSDFASQSCGWTSIPLTYAIIWE